MRKEVDELDGGPLDVWEEVAFSIGENDANGMSCDLLLHGEGRVNLQELLSIDFFSVVDIDLRTVGDRDGSLGSRASRERINHI